MSYVIRIADKTFYSNLYVNEFLMSWAKGAAIWTKKRSEALKFETEAAANELVRSWSWKPLIQKNKRLVGRYVKYGALYATPGGGFGQKEDAYLWSYGHYAHTERKDQLELGRECKVVKVFRP